MDQLRGTLLIAMLVAFSANAATFLVPNDRALIASSKAIVVATAGEPAGRWTHPWIETVTPMVVEESIRGPLHAGDEFDDVELGGAWGAIGLSVPGAPRFRPGERVLLSLQKNDRGEWAARSMALGKFTFSGELLLRDSSEIGYEPHRNAAKFLAYVRKVSRGENPAVDYVVLNGAAAPSPPRIEATSGIGIGTYLLQCPGSGLPMRWPNPTATFLAHGTQPNALSGGVISLQRGLASWTNDGSSNVVYGYGGSTGVAQAFISSDSVNTVQFNDPAGEIAGSYTGTGGDVLAIGGAWCGSSYTYNGETFATIFEADLVVQNGISGPGLVGNGFDHVLAHELGHTLGFRHSDDPPAGGTFSTTALMNSSVNFNNDPSGAALQAWDREAVAAVYGNGSTPNPTPNPTPGPTPNPLPFPQPNPQPCTPPSLLVQPQPASITGNATATLSVIASGAGLTYQWFTGTSGISSSPLNGGTQSQITINPSVTTSYWVRVANDCTTIDSNAAVVTVNGCPPVLLTGAGASASAIFEGKSATLTASATTASTTLLYQWFNGTSGDKSRPIGAGASVVVSPEQTASYWVNVTNDCGAAAFSDTITILVARCDAPNLVVPPAGGAFVPGDSVTLSAIVTGSLPMSLQWMQNGSPVINATTSTVTVGPLFATSSFALHASNDCGELTTTPVTFTVAPQCVAPSITLQPASQSIVNGATAILTVAANGTALTYRWYEGQVFDFTHPVGASAPSFVTPPLEEETQYWVRVENECGSVNSAAATVTPITSRRRGVRH